MLGKLERVPMISRTLQTLRGFLGRQAANFRVLMVRGACMYSMWGLTQNYTSIYTVRLGADPVQLGSLSGIGSLVNAFISAPVGWLADRYSLKKMFLLGLAIEALVPLTYALSGDWRMVMIPTILFSVTMVTTWMIESVLLANTLRDEDRATGFGVISSVGQVPMIVTPTLAGLIVTRLGGISVEAIRPLFYINFVGSFLMVLWVYWRLRDVKTGSTIFQGGFLRSFKEVLRGEGVKRWLFIELLGSFSFGSTMPFTMVYAAEIKHADAMTLGFMGSAMTLASLVSSIPLGKLADKIGRKKAIVFLRPFLYLSYILFIWAPRTEFLILAFALRGILWSSFNVWLTMQMEMVPIDQRGRWGGVINTLRSIIRVPAPIVGGILWTYLDPSTPFFLLILIDAAVRMPVLWTIPETLALPIERTLR